MLPYDADVRCFHRRMRDLRCEGIGCGQGSHVGSESPYAKEPLWGASGRCSRLMSRIPSAARASAISDHGSPAASAVVSQSITCWRGSRNALRRRFMTSSATAWFPANVGSQDLISHPRVRR